VNNPIADPTLDNCNCCEGDPAEVELYNRPGLPALAYRLGTHATFLRRMVSRLTTDKLPDGPNVGLRPLADLTTRSSDDASIALLDAAAVMADVLAFYQERIVNEGFLRTATERRSILELARAIGYELNPGVAASTFLAFTVETAIGSPESAFVATGSKVQSIPPQNELPQTFETTEDLTARAAWNALRPRLSQPQVLSASSKQVYLTGTATNLKQGDVLLILIGTTASIKRVLKVEVQAELKRTRVVFDLSAAATPFTPPTLFPGNPAWFAVNQVPQNAYTMTLLVGFFEWTDSDFNTFLKVNEWNATDLQKFWSALRQSIFGDTNANVYAFRARAGFFGNNAPLWKSLPLPDKTRGDSYTIDWDANPRTIWTNSQGGDYGTARAYLDRTVAEIVNDSWVVLQASPTYQRAYQVKGTTEASLADYGLSAKATGLDLYTPTGSVYEDTTFMVRSTSAYVQSEALTVAELPIEDVLPAGLTELMLDQLTLGLLPDQAVALSGERADAPGVLNSEILILKAINHVGGFTVLTFESGLQYAYQRATVSINANVTRATHGETIKETLGSGNAAQINQRFTLKRPPLTYVSASTPSGNQSTLSVRVGDVLWAESPSLYPLDDHDQDYIVRLDDDSKATVIFGDGEKGARLPSGTQNITATYRTGIGLSGEVAANSLTMLQSRPLGIRGVTNPLAASGAADPATFAEARTNAPLTVLTLDRIVSLPDYENFTRAFNGIGKAQAVALWNDEHYLIHITIAGANGKSVDVNSDLYRNLLKAIDAARDPAQQVRVDNFKLLTFNLDATVIIDERYEEKLVLAQIEADLNTAFAFAQRSFGQPVTAAEVVTLMQQVPGVIATDLNQLYVTGATAQLNQVLSAPIAYLLNGAVQPARLLLINSVGVKIAAQ
jgi:predicted phage baseplate assembly protein